MQKQFSTNLTCRKLGQGQLSVIININFVELEYIMLHAKFQDHYDYKFCRKIFLKVSTIYGHGGHLSHVTWTIYIKFLSPFPMRLHMKFGIDWSGGFRGEDV